MPMLDPGFVAMDPMVADRMLLTRRTVQVDDKGRAQVPRPASVCYFWGTVTMADPGKLDRSEDAQDEPRVISIVTRRQLRGSGDVGPDGQHPDVVSWRGTDYTVDEVQPYPQFGQGFYQVTARAMAARVAPI
jgi:hypothetical protein